jgi:agmatinase
MQSLLPRVYGSTPTLFGAPLARTEEELRQADVAFLGIPWRAPSPDSRIGSAQANYEGTLFTPTYFRVNSIRYGGYLPELDLDVFERVRLVDRGDVEVRRDMRQTLEAVEGEVNTILDAGCIPVTMGGNAGPSTYPVVKAIAGRAGGPTAVLNFDAHHDNERGAWEDDDPAQPRWASTWARRILDLPGVDPGRYYHIGLRGPRNDRDTFVRFTEKGVKRENIGTYRDLKRAREAGYDRWAREYAETVVDGAATAWIAIDPDVLNLGANPDWGDEPLGPTSDEVIELVYQTVRAAGRERFGGLSYMATPYDAPSLQYILLYILLYALAGLAAPGR